MRILVPFLFLFLLSCTSEVQEHDVQDSLKVIYLDDLTPNVENLNLSDIAESIEYIPLETDEECLIDKIVDVQLSDDYIFIRRVGELYQFDQDGNFIRKLFRIGKGPGECYARDFSLDNVNELVYVFDNYKYKYNTYSFDGEFLGSMADPNPMESTGSNFLFQNDQLIFEISDYSPPPNTFMSFDLDREEILYKHVNEDYETLKDIGKRRRICVSGFIRKYEDLILFKEKFRDTLFQTTDFTDISPRYIFNGSRNRLSYKDYYTKPSQVIEDKKYVESYYETSKYLFVYYCSLSFPFHLLIFDKESDSVAIKNLHHIGDYTIYNDFDDGPGISLFQSLTFGWFQDEYIYTYIEPQALIEEFRSGNLPAIESNRIHNLIAQVSVNDNPILIKIKLKSYTNY